MGPTTCAFIVVTAFRFITNYPSNLGVKGSWKFVFFMVIRKS